MASETQVDVSLVADQDIQTKEVPTSPSTEDELVITWARWPLLFFICIYAFATYFVFDFPGSIGMGPEHTIQAKFYAHGHKYTQEMNQVLYSVYSWPNTCLAIFGGLLIDKFLGLRKAIVLFGSLILLSQIVFYIGVKQMNYPLMVTGRVLFGLGGESQYVSWSTFLGRWYKHAPGMAIAYGITIGTTRLGSALTFWVSPILARDYGVDFVCFLGVIFSILSFIAGGVLVVADTKGQKRRFVAPQAAGTAEAMHLSDIKKFPLMTWMLYAIVVASYSAMVPFVDIGKNFFERMYGVSGPTGSRWVSYYQLTAGVVLPFAGTLIDRFGGFVFWTMGGCFGFIVIHLLFIFAQLPGQLMMVIFGFSYVLLCVSLWPTLPYTVPQRVSGIAFGFMTALQNLGMALFPLLVGAVLDAHTAEPTKVATPATPAPTNGTMSSALEALYLAANDNSTGIPTAPKAQLADREGFIVVEWIFVAMACLALSLCGLLFWLDRRSASPLVSVSATTRKQALAEREANENSKLIDIETA